MIDYIQELAQIREKYRKIYDTHHCIHCEYNKSTSVGDDDNPYTWFELTIQYGDKCEMCNEHDNWRMSLEIQEEERDAVVDVLEREILRIKHFGFDDETLLMY